MTEQQKLMLVLIMRDVMEAIDELLTAKGQPKRFHVKMRDIQLIALQISNRIEEERVEISESAKVRERVSTPREHRKRGASHRR